jgi:CheY-like chemotaxis protein
MMGVQVASSRRILLVDDEPENLDVLSVLLEDDFEIHVARGGQEALSIFSSIGDFAAVISDQRMPGMTGVELMIELRRLSPATVRMVLTGYSDLPPIIAAVNEGSVYRLFLKPWSPDEMRAAVADAVWIYEAQGALNRLVDLLAERKRELATTLAQLRRSQNELLASERMSTLGRFAAGITHNIRNSLTVMMHLVDTVQQKPAAPKLLRAAQHAFQTLDALLQVANDVSSLGRGKLDAVRLASVEMAPFLERVVAAFAQESEGRTRPVSVTIAPNAGRLSFDHARVQKALLALLRSCAHASPPATPLAIIVHAVQPMDPDATLTPGAPVQPLGSQGEACIEVCAEAAPPPGHSDGPGSSETAELTLGLEVSRVVAEAHGGRLVENSRPGRGLALELWMANPDPEDK